MYKKLRSSSHINNWSVDGLLSQPSLDPLSRLVRCAPTPPGTRFKTPSTDRLRTVRPNWEMSAGRGCVNIVPRTCSYISMTPATVF